MKPKILLEYAVVGLYCRRSCHCTLRHFDPVVNRRTRRTSEETGMERFRRLSLEQTRDSDRQLSSTSMERSALRDTSFSSVDDPVQRSSVSFSEQRSGLTPNRGRRARLQPGLFDEDLEIAASADSEKKRHRP